MDATGFTVNADLAGATDSVAVPNWQALSDAITSASSDRTSFRLIMLLIR
jgi:hypothetical protein